jgi:serine phosphatase RsbU (regulator of sigma subunit)
VDVLRASAGRSVESIIADVFAAIDAFVGPTPQFDDITLLVARRDPDSR